MQSLQAPQPLTINLTPPHSSSLIASQPRFLACKHLATVCATFEERGGTRSSSQQCAKITSNLLVTLSSLESTEELQYWSDRANPRNNSEDRNKIQNIKTWPYQGPPPGAWAGALPWGLGVAASCELRQEVCLRFEVMGLPKVTSSVLVMHH